VSSQPRKRRAWRRLAGHIFVLAAFAFLGSFIIANVRQLQQHEWSVQPALLTLSIVVQAIGLASGVVAWQLLLRRMDIHVPFVPLARVRFVSGLARYMPGKIWPFVSAARLAAPLGISATATITSLAAHTVFSLIAALLVSAWFLPLEAVSVGVRLELLRWLAPGLLVLAHPRIIRIALDLVARLTRQDVARWTGSWAAGLGLVAWSVVGWILSGLALGVFIQSLTPLPATAFAAVIGINAFAFVVGQAFFIAPAGLGAKEGTLAALLATFVTLPVAALLAVGVRLWGTVVELLLVLALMRRRDVAADAGRITP
jgi:glycosyltransferase 2 family protein